MVICNVQDLKISVKHQGRFAQIGVAKMDFALEEFVIAILDTMVMIAAKLHAQVGNTMTKLLKRVFLVALQELMKTNIPVPVYCVIQHVMNAETNQPFVQVAFPPHQILNILFLLHQLVSVSVLLILIKMVIIVRIVMQLLTAQLAHTPLPTVHPA